MLTCDEALELISASLDGPLRPDEAVRLEEHLKICAPCRALRAGSGVPPRSAPAAECPGTRGTPPSASWIKSTPSPRWSRCPGGTVCPGTGGSGPPRRRSLLWVLPGGRRNWPGPDHRAARESTLSSLRPRPDGTVPQSAPLCPMGPASPLFLPPVPPLGNGGYVGRSALGIRGRSRTEALLPLPFGRALPTSVPCLYSCPPRLPFTGAKNLILCRLLPSHSLRQMGWSRTLPPPMEPRPTPGTSDGLQETIQEALVLPLGRGIGDRPPYPKCPA